MKSGNHVPGATKATAYHTSLNGESLQNKYIRVGISDKEMPRSSTAASPVRVKCFKRINSAYVET